MAKISRIIIAPVKCVCRNMKLRVIKWNIPVATLTTPTTYNCQLCLFPPQLVLKTDMTTISTRLNLMKYKTMHHQPSIFFLLCFLSFSVVENLPDGFKCTGITYLLPKGIVVVHGMQPKDNR